MTYYYTLHDEGTDYEAATITSKEGETISQFGRRILLENEFEDRKCVVYPAGAASKAFARATKVADHFNQHQHGTSEKPFRVELKQQSNDLLQKLKIACLERDNYMLMALQSKPTTEKLLAGAEDTLVNAFDTGTTVSVLWLPMNSKEQVWQAPWSSYAVADAKRQETNTIQPAIDKEFAPEFPQSSPYAFIDTHKGWEKMTPDAMLILRDQQHVELSIAAIFEWVGQDEKPFPSKKHKAKFIRDCVRVHQRCGGDRQVHGIISDLARIIAVKLVGLKDDGTPIVVKTPVFSGDGVQDVLTRFAFAPAAALSVRDISWDMHCDGSNVINVRAGRVLGSGLHGKVYTVEGDESQFVKTFETNTIRETEANMLTRLKANEVKHVPMLLGKSADGLSMLASPVGQRLALFQSQAGVWALGAPLVDCLEAAHTNCGVCHRDIRPENIAVLTRLGSPDTPLLFDWACASTADIQALFSGSVHYAANAVLEELANNRQPIPAFEHDLESLVYTLYDVSRMRNSRPPAIAVSGSLNDPSAYAATVQKSWNNESQKSQLLRELVGLARARDYTGLKEVLMSKY